MFQCLWSQPGVLIIGGDWHGGTLTCHNNKNITEKNSMIQRVFQLALLHMLA